MGFNPLKSWCCWRGLNSRPPPYQGGALPLSYSSNSLRIRRTVKTFSTHEPALYSGTGPEPSDGRHGSSVAWRVRTRRVPDDGNRSRPLATSAHRGTAATPRLSACVATLAAEAIGKTAAHCAPRLRSPLPRWPSRRRPTGCRRCRSRARCLRSMNCWTRLDVCAAARATHSSHGRQAPAAAATRPAPLRAREAGRAAAARGGGLARQFAQAQGSGAVAGGAEAGVNGVRTGAWSHDIRRVHRLGDGATRSQPLRTGCR